MAHLRYTCKMLTCRPAHSIYAKYAKYNLKVSHLIKANNLDQRCSVKNLSLFRLYKL